MYTGHDILLSKNVFRCYTYDPVLIITLYQKQSPSPTDVFGSQEQGLENYVGLWGWRGVDGEGGCNSEEHLCSFPYTSIFKFLKSMYYFLNLKKKFKLQKNSIHLYKMSRTETVYRKSKLVVAKGWGKGKMGNNC